MAENETGESFEVRELDDQELEDVAGGGTNGNCPCPPGSSVPAGSWDNGNCSGKDEEMA